MTVKSLEVYTPLHLSRDLMYYCNPPIHHNHPLPLMPICHAVHHLLPHPNLIIIIRDNRGCTYQESYSELSFSEHVFYHWIICAPMTFSGVQKSYNKFSHSDCRDSNGATTNSTWRASSSITCRPITPPSHSHILPIVEAVSPFDI